MALLQILIFDIFYQVRIGNSGQFIKITAVESITDELLSLGVDGLLGMGFGEMKYSTIWFKEAFKEGKLRENRFGVWLDRDAGRNDDVQGEMCLGCIDPSKFSGENLYSTETYQTWKKIQSFSGLPTCTPLTSPDYWQFSAQKITFGNVILCENDCPVILDTGAKETHMPKKALTYIFEVWKNLVSEFSSAL